MQAIVRALVLGVALLTAGCFGASEDASDPKTPRPGDDVDADAPSTCETPPCEDPPANDTKPERLVVDGPTWKVGDAWTLQVEWDDSRGASTWELVTFLADGEHYWLGSPDRAQSLDHVVTDVNPLIGRIHYGILSPHESGRHAGMYEFPLQNGSTWKGFFFGEEWTFRASESTVQGGAGAEPGFRITGTIPGNDAANLGVDYVPSEKWFRNLHIQGASGGDVTLTVTERSTKDSGTYYFHRGPDVLDETLATTTAGQTEQTFTVEETEHLKVLLATVEGNSTAASTTLEFVAPDGTVAGTFSGTTFDGRLQVEDPQVGKWTVRLTAIGGDASVHVKAWAVDEHTGTLG